MQFPEEWVEYEMYPKALSELQISRYEEGNEEASEHDRCGAFHWWLKQDPSKEQLEKLMKLAYLDPEPLMGEDVRSYIKKAANYTERVGKAWGISNITRAGS